MSKDNKCCDTCKRYHWYEDWCDKYECEVDARNVCGGYESQEENLRKERDNK